ncbi:tubulin-like doman-containing protein [Candidatus Poriferisodalis sp.]|uniref:tubulin-like doman-containing protein n=1 Tax=Candidatus Poriferisodalis sp. TaxID=3101277 RepID=UPI003B5AF4CC
MYSKFLFVGLGGSGGKTLRFLKREIQQWMAAHDAGHRIPGGWQFLHIDTPVRPDGDEIDDKADPLDADEYLGLISAGVDFRALQNILDGNPRLWPEMQTWRVEPAGLNVGVQLGAGQMRAVGQTVAMAYALRIRQKLDERVRRITAPGARGEIGDLYGEVTGQQADPDSNMYIVVVSSLAGGTGAGLLNLVCDILRGLETPAGDNIFALLYTPEVFHSLGGAAVGGVYPNSLAAISEILNGQWWQGSDIGSPNLAAPKESEVLRQAGLPNAQVRSGPTYPFLVGRVGEGGVDHGTPDRLFEMAGRSLLSWVSDKVVQARFVAYTAGNWANSASSQQQGEILVDQGELHERGLPCFSALGFSRLSVGTEYLERYALQRLVKDALGHLTRYHSDSDEAVQVGRELATEDPDVILTEIAKHHLPAFLRQAGLTELGPDDNEIVDELRPPDHAQLRDEFERDARARCGLDEDHQLDAEGWRSTLSDSIEAAQQSYERNYQALLATSTLEWIPKISERVVRTVEQWVASHGLLVAAELCRMVASYLAHEVHEDLTANDVDRQRAWSHDWGTAVNEALDGMRGKVSSTDARLEEALLDGVHYAAWAGEALVSERAAAMANEVAERVLRPMVRTLREAHGKAEIDAANTVTWVSWDDEPPPDSVRPPAGDFPLVDPEDYPETFASLLARDVGSTDRTQEQREAARRIIISGSFRDGSATGADSGQLECVRIERDWWPSAATAAGGSHSQTEVRISLGTSLDDVKTRATAWLQRPGSAWARYLGMTIRSFVGTTEAHDALGLSESEVRKNRSRLLNQIGEAVSAAAPLINLDANLVGLVHPNAAQASPRLQLSSVPLEAHAIESEVRARLARTGLNDDDIEGLLSSDASIKHIDITSALAAPVSVLVVESLLRPIAERWYQCDTPTRRKDFWTRRRAQPLDSFVPVPQALLRCMVRGWFTGRLLGRIARDGDSYVIYSSRTRGPVAFPPNFLSVGRASGEQDSLALVLEALALAYVDVCRTGTLDPLLPYIELRELGTAVPNGALHSYESLGPALADWAGSRHSAFVLDDGIPLLESAESPHEADSEVGRLRRIADICRRTLQSYGARYSEHLRRCEASPDVLSSAPQWIGLWDRFMRPALNDLIQAAESEAQGLENREPEPLM